MSMNENVNAFPVEYPGETKLPLVVVIDRSGSMHGYERELEDGLRLMKETIEEDDIARGMVEVSVITFSDSVEMAHPFSSAPSMEVPSIACGGCTHTHEAISAAIRAVEDRKQEYKRLGLSYKQPWIWLLTDGYDNDPDNGSFERLLQLQQNMKATFFGFAVGRDPRLAVLGAMNKDGVFFQVNRENLRDAFVYISQSVSGYTDSLNSGKDYRMTAPGSELGVNCMRVPAGATIGSFQA